MKVAEQKTEERITVPYEKILDFLKQDVRIALGKKHVYTSTEWKIYAFVLMKMMYFPDGQPKEVPPYEEEFIVMLREQGFSMHDIAFALDRSSATVHNVLKKNGAKVPLISPNR